MNIFGPIITGDDLWLAMRYTLEKWTPTYLAEVSAQAGESRDFLPPFRSYTEVTDFFKWPEEQIPGCIIVSPGLLSPPDKNGSSYTAEWQVGAGCVVSSKDKTSTMRLVKLYCAAIRAVVEQHQSLRVPDENGVEQPFASNVQWLDESYDELGSDQRRTMGAGMVAFGVEVQDVLDKRAGPREPLRDIHADPPENSRVRRTSVKAEG